MVSSDFVDEIHARLREEIQRLWPSIVIAAQVTGEKDSQRLRDVLTGRQKLPIDLFARLVEEGVDAGYVLQGRRAYAASKSSPALAVSEPESRLLSDYRACAQEERTALLGVAHAMAGGKPAKVKKPAARKSAAPDGTARSKGKAGRPRKPSTR